MTMIAQTQEQCNQLGQLVGCMFRLETATNKVQALEVLMDEHGHNSENEITNVVSYAIHSSEKGGAQIIVKFKFIDINDGIEDDCSFFVFYDEAGKLQGDF